MQHSRAQHIRKKSELSIVTTAVVVTNINVSVSRSDLHLVEISKLFTKPHNSNNQLNYELTSAKICPCCLGRHTRFFCPCASLKTALIVDLLSALPDRTRIKLSIAFEIRTSLPNSEKTRQIRTIWATMNTLTMENTIALVSITYWNK